MKKLYHLLVTSYKLRVKLPRFCFAKSPLQNLKGIYYPHIISSSHHVGSLRATTLLILIFLLPFFAFAQPPVPMSEAEVTDVVFSCPGIVEITYDLNVSSCVEVTLEYSPDKCAWALVPDAEGDLGPQISGGSNKKITWDAAAHNASFGKLYFRVLYPYVPTCNELDGVMVNGICWAKYNLNEIGGIYENHAYSTGNNSAALYQWGRLADGHAKRNSTTYSIQSSTDDPGHDMFIMGSTDWHTTPANNFLWNSGTETCPVKTDFDPCPEHWRVPTRTELETLGVPVTNETYVTKVWQDDYEVSGVSGYLCTDNSSGNSLFLPAAGYRNYSNGSLLEVGTYGRYWSSAPLSTYAYGLSFDSDSFSTSYVYRAIGYSVRCVSEN